MDHFPNKFFSSFNARIDFILFSHLGIFMNVFKVNVHDFSLKFVFLFVDLSHVLVHEVVDVDVVIASTGSVVSFTTIARRTPWNSNSIS